MRKKVGVNGLRKHYGTRDRRGTLPEHSRKAAGKCIRHCLMQLEEIGMIGTTKFYSNEGVTITMGKALTTKGRMDMDRMIAHIGPKKKSK